MMLLAEELTHALVELDAEYVFGVSGANIEHLHDAIYHNKKISSVLAKTEIGAGYMADARARKTNKLAVCCSTSGAGMMNLLVGLAESRAEYVPVLAIIGQAATSLDGNGAFQDSSGLPGKVDALALVSACTKDAIRLTSTDDFWEIFTDLIVTALSGEQGPVALIIPRDIFMQNIAPMPLNWMDAITAKTSPATPAMGAVEEFMPMLRLAKNPLLILGEGVNRSRAREFIDDFTLQTRLPVATTMSAKGAFDHFEDNFIGNSGVAGHENVNRYAEQADLIIVVGCKLDVMNRGHVLQAAARGTRIVAINSATPYCAEDYPSIVFYKSEPGLFFKEVLKALAEDPYSYQGSYPAIEYSPFQPVSEREPAPDELSLSLAMKTISPFIREDEHVFIDAGNTGVTALHFLRLPAKCRSTIALGMGGMGYSFAAVVGAQIGGQQRAWVIAGDGAFLMGGIELHCAIEQQLPVLFIVFNDHMHGMCKTRQRVFFNNSFESVDYSEVNIHQIANGLATPSRLFSRRVETMPELIDALSSYQQQDIKTGIIEILLDYEEWPPFSGLPSTNRQ
jgi:acetolactate synthase-1/2/3 large subunit